MKRKLSFFAALVLSVGLFTSIPAGAEGPAVSLRVEGMDKTLYYNGTMDLDNTEAATMRDVVDRYNALNSVLPMTVADAGGVLRIAAVGELKEKSLGSPFNDAWSVRLNGQDAKESLELIRVKAGDDIVVYYADKSLMQYPAVDLNRLLSDGIVRFTSPDASNAAGDGDAPESPIAGATVVWDGMTYLTDTNGEIIIDSTGAGVPHTLSIARYYDNGLPTVLRFAPGYFVKYGYDDVAPGDWFYEAVMSVSDRQVMSGVTETSFGPGAPVNRAMAVALLGHLAGADVDQTAETGFSDVVSDGWSAGYIKWARDNGISGGNPDGTFGQYQAITREQLAALLYRLAKLQGFDTGAAAQTLSGFADGAAVSAYAAEPMMWAVAVGIITGASGRLEPQGTATRAQVAVMLQRFIAEYMP